MDKITLYKREHLRTDRNTRGRVITYNADIPLDPRSPQTLSSTDLSSLIDYVISTGKIEKILERVSFVNLTSANCIASNRYWDHPLEQREFSAFMVGYYRKLEEAKS